MNLGEVIKRRRERLNWNQAKLAEMAEIGSAADISRIERGRQWPPEHKLHAIASALGCKLYELFAEAEGAKAIGVSVQQASPEYGPFEAGASSDGLGEEILKAAEELEATVDQFSAAHATAMTILAKAIAKQLDASALLDELMAARETVRPAQKTNPLLLELLTHLITQLAPSQHKELERRVG